METLISQRIATGKHCVSYRQGNSFQIRCCKLKMKFAILIIAMSKCHHPSRLYNSLQLISDLIISTSYQESLDSYKRPHCGITEENGKYTLGKGYWSGFMRQDRKRLDHAKPQKFVLDGANWFKCGLFYDMYDSIEKALIKAKVMTILEGP